MMGTALNAILFLFLGASLVYMAILRYRMRAARPPIKSNCALPSSAALRVMRLWLKSVSARFFFKSGSHALGACMSCASSPRVKFARCGLAYA